MIGVALGPEERDDAVTAAAEVAVDGQQGEQRLGASSRQGYATISVGAFQPESTE